MISSPHPHPPRISVEGWKDRSEQKLKTGLTGQLLRPFLLDMVYSFRREHLRELVGQNFIDDLLAQPKDYWCILAKEIFRGPTVTRKLIPSKQETERWGRITLA